MEYKKYYRFYAKILNTRTNKTSFKYFKAYNIEDAEKILKDKLLGHEMITHLKEVPW